ncbi:MAG TPA: FGGY-family carbohydrate kinase [Gaiellaceae bacterium]|nr:FGGY-family carbohydrate kinase [Gaiellaceae bacterium]
MLRVAAVDMGATSVRVAVIDLEAEAPNVEIVHRWHHSPKGRPDGSVRWRWAELIEKVYRGLERALGGGPLASIGVDGWAVDYGLLDDEGRLLSDPHSYRSPRTERWRDTARSLGEAELYRRTGIQLMPINTIFQLAAHDAEELARAATLVMLPELVAYELTGEVASERSNAGTTGLLDVATGEWAADLAEAVGVNPVILPPAERAGRLLGHYRGTPVHLVAAHDTACAFAASPLDGDRRALVSAGTWFLVGVERSTPDTSEAARESNFSNEIGAVGGYRFLKNVTGFWLLERCAAEWGVTGRDALAMAAEASGAPVFDVGDERFLAPASMDAEVRAAAGIADDAARAVVARSIVESVATGVARVVEELARHGRRIRELVIAGGASSSPFVRDRLAATTDLQVLAGAMEASALGNALVQGIALGRFADLREGRRWVSGSRPARPER